MAGAVTIEALAASVEGVDTGQRFRAVFDAPTAAAIRADAELAAATEALLGNDTGRLWEVDEELGYSAGCVGDVVAFGLADERGAPAAYLEADDERVRKWFTARFDGLVDAAAPLSVKKTE